MEIQRINKALKANNGQISAAATDLGISRNALYRRLEKYQLA
jgi:transcriptional regulator of acetoin/glycerol metabolism